MAEESERTLSTGKLSRALGRSPSTIKRLCDDGKIRYGRTPGGQRRFNLEEVLADLGVQQLDPRQTIYCDLLSPAVESQLAQPTKGGTKVEFYDPKLNADVELTVKATKRARPRSSLDKFLFGREGAPRPRLRGGI